MFLIIKSWNLGKGNNLGQNMMIGQSLVTTIPQYDTLEHMGRLYSIGQKRAVKISKKFGPPQPIFGSNDSLIEWLDIS